MNKLEFPKEQHGRNAVPPPQPQAQPRGELISVGKEPQAAVTQSPAAEITGAKHSLLGTAITIVIASTYHQLLTQSPPVGKTTF